MSIGIRIKEIRNNAKLSQIEFAKTISIDNGSLSKIESGKLTPTIEQILEISSKFGVTTDHILRGSESDISEEIVMQEEKAIYEISIPVKSFPEKLRRLISHKNLTIGKFAEEIQYSRGSIHNYLSGAVSPTYEFLMKLVKRYPEIDLDMLLRDLKEKPYKSILYNKTNEQFGYIDLLKTTIAKLEENAEEIKKTLGT